MASLNSSITPYRSGSVSQCVHFRRVLFRSHKFQNLLTSLSFACSPSDLPLRLSSYDSCGVDVIGSYASTIPDSWVNMFPGFSCGRAKMSDRLAYVCRMCPPTSYLALNYLSEIPVKPESFLTTTDQYPQWTCIGLPGYWVENPSGSSVALHRCSCEIPPMDA
jgi:hypothetical protein